MVVELSCRVIMISVVRRWSIFWVVVEAHVFSRCCLAALVLNFKVRKYFNPNFTYDRLLNAHNYVFT